MNMPDLYKNICLLNSAFCGMNHNFNYMNTHKEGSRFYKLWEKDFLEEMDKAIGCWMEILN